MSADILKSFPTLTGDNSKLFENTKKDFIKKSVCEPDNGHKSEITVSSDLTLESERLKTFKNWKNDAIAPETLAKAGFYFLNHSDAVKCAFCKVEGCRWESSDNPLEDHALWSPNCPFIKERKSSVLGSIQSSIPANRDVCGSRELFMNSVPETETSKFLAKIGYIKPCSYSEYSTYEKRLQSFEHWPKSLKQKPKSLAEAGFFYKGVGDQTMCFHCAGGLKDWEDSDDPWEQHALWFPKCNFLVLSKGQEFVNKVQSKFSNEDESAPSTSSSNLSTKEESAEKKSEQVDEKKTEDNSSMLCKICYKNELEIIFIPCGHVVACVDCSLSLNKVCPVCRKTFNAAVRAFLS